MKPQTYKQSGSGGVGVSAYPLLRGEELSEKSAGWRASTIIDRTKAVERVILAMRERPSHPFTLQELADIAIMSPSHFDRVFHDIVGIPPRLFLSALRLEAAKHLLLTTRLNVIDVCYEVGYDSLGTFTSRFTDFVGLPPTSLRQMRDRSDFNALAAQFEKELPLCRPGPKDGTTGLIKAPEGFNGLVFVGFFESAIPQTEPVACDLRTTPGEYQIGPVPDGQYYVLAAGFNNTSDPLTTLLAARTLRGKAGPVVVREGAVSGPTDVTLRETRLTDPPIVVALPLLLAQRNAHAVVT